MKHILTSVKTFIGLVIMLLFSVLLALLAWGSWKMHAHEKLSRKFLTEGQHVEVQVATADRGNRVWYDQFTSPVYISFDHQGRTYTTRCIQDSGWINEGDKVSLLYLPELDGFWHPHQQIHFHREDNRSGLLDFTVVNMWSDERKWEVLGVAFSVAAFLFLLSGLIAVLPMPLLIQIRRLIGTGLVLAAALYFTYNTWQYYGYFNKMRDNGREMTVTVLETDYRSRSRRSNWWYSYYATVQYNKGKKVIPIEEEHYDRLKPKDALKVIYNETLDDMMPVDYSREYSGIFISLFMWGLCGFLGYQFFLKRKKGRSILDGR